MSCGFQRGIGHRPRSIEPAVTTQCGGEHDFGIPAFGVGTGIVQFGTEKGIVFRVPEKPASANYICTPHSAMMSGSILFAK